MDKVNKHFYPEDDVDEVSEYFREIPGNSGKFLPNRTEENRTEEKGIKKPDAPAVAAPLKEEQEAQIKNLGDALRQKGFDKVFAFIGQARKGKKNNDAIIHTLRSCLLRFVSIKNGNYYGYCVDVISKENGNYNERVAIAEHEKIKQAEKEPVKISTILTVG